MNITIPEIPAAIVTLLSFFAPYAIAIINRPSWSPAAKNLVSIVVALAIAAVALVVYFVLTGAPLPASLAEWVTLGLLAIVVCATSYKLVTKPSAAALEVATSKRDVDLAA